MSDAPGGTTSPAADARPAAPDAPDDATRGRNFPCESCGADLEFNIGVQTLRCPYCGHVKQLAEPGRQIGEQDLDAMLARMRALREDRAGDAAPQEAGLREVECGSCRATVRFQGNLTSAHCSYCGSPLQLDRVHDAKERVPVDGVLPFAVERHKARERLAAWVKSRWFAPTEFTKRGVQGRFQGVYLPYWTFDAMTDTSYTGMRGDHYYVTVGSGKNRRRVRKTRWTPAAGRFQRFFDDTLVVASTGIPKARVDALEPWPLEGCRPWAPELLAGFQARTYDVELEQGFAEGRKAMEGALRAEVMRRIGGDTQRITSMDTAWDALTYKHLLLPLWMMAFRFGKKSYQVVVNAVTGEVQGDRPYSWVKITLAALAGAAVLALGVWIRSRMG